MAQTIVITDDLDGTHDARAVSFALDGREYSIDLAEKNYAKLEASLAPFISVARRSNAAKKPAASKSRAAELKQIREWAAANGHEVPSRGRIPQAVMDAYASR